MFERFTEKAIKVIMLGQEESRRLGHNFVGTEQILLGLIGEGTGIGPKVLRSMGINLKDARVEVEKTTKRHKRGEIYRSEINLKMAGASFRAEATDEKLFNAIDESRNEMAKELRRHKGKKEKSVRKGGAKIKAMARGEE